MTGSSRKKLLSVNSTRAVKNVRYYQVSSDNSRLEPTVKSPECLAFWEARRVYLAQWAAENTADGAMQGALI